MADLWQLTTALWQLQAGAFLQQTEATQAALQEQYAVDAGMLDAVHSDPRTLDWLAATHVMRAPSRCGRTVELQIVGRYDPEGLLPDLIGRYTTPEQFPPGALIGAARAQHRGVCIVVPVRTKDRDWGLLAVVGEINTGSALETYRHWATQLCASFDGQELQAAVRESEERYALAARASNDGLWEWYPPGTDFFMSERSFALLGVEPEPTADRLALWLDLVHPDDLGEFGELMQRRRVGAHETATPNTACVSPTGRTGGCWPVRSAWSLAGGAITRSSARCPTSTSVTASRTSCVRTPCTTP